MCLTFHDAGCNPYSFSVPIDDLPEVAYFLTCLPICLNADMHMKSQMTPIEVSKIAVKLVNIILCC